MRTRRQFGVERIMESVGEKIIFALCAVIVVAAVYAEIDESNKWDEFSRQHNRKVIERIKGGTSTGFGVCVNGQSGVVLVDEPDKTRFKCNDGIIYTR